MSSGTAGWAVLDFLQGEKNLQGERTLATHSLETLATLDSIEQEMRLPSNAKQSKGPY
jgi:hypothetical protein